MLSCSQSPSSRALPRRDGKFSHLTTGTYVIPGDPDNSIYFIPCSGGADSTAMAILMHDLYPEIDFRLFFTDTKAESKELLASLARLETYLGKAITRIVPEKGLYEKIVEYNGFLPSSQARWCTRELKLQPYEAYVKDIRTGSEIVYAMVGIRKDEPERTGLVSYEDHIVTELPFRDLGIGREQVFQILETTIGIPSFYKFRVRSGCACCPFQRKAELIGLMEFEPVEFEIGASFEKLIDADLARFPDNAVRLEEECNSSPNWHTLPVPADLLSPGPANTMPVKWGKRAPAGQAVMTLFGGEPMAALWVGAEFFVNQEIGGTGVWWQRIVTLSTSRAGLQAQLQSHYEHRISTPEVQHHLTVEEMKAELRLVTYVIEVPARLMDIGKVSTGSYVWSGDGTSYSRLKHLYQWARRSLFAEGMRRLLKQYSPYEDRSMSWQFEQMQILRREIESIRAETGEVLGVHRFYPVDELHEELDERKIACFMCSI